MKNRVLVYSYLASLNNLNKTEEYMSMFKDVVKHCISALAKDSPDFLVTDLVDEIRERYDIDMPSVVVEAIINKFIPASEVLLTADGSIITKEIELTEYYHMIEDSKASIIQLEEDFVDFSRLKGHTEQLSIIDLVHVYEDNVLSMCKSQEDLGDKYKVHFEYLKYIERDVIKRKVFQNIILGTLIARCVLNNEQGNTAFEGSILLLDSSFIVSVLGLHSEASNKTCGQVVSISRDLGFKFVIFDKTLGEVSNLLKETARKIKELDYVSDIFDDDITKSCFLNPNITATDLERIASNIQVELEEKIEFELKKMEFYVGKANEHPRYTYLMEKLHKNKYSALHDTVAFLFVRNIRGHDVRKMSDAKCWFVQDRKSSRNRLRKDSGFINEVVSSHDLLVMLWINRPEVFNLDKISDTEFMKLLSIASGYTEPNRSIVEEYEKNLSKYATKEFSLEEIARLRRAVFSMSADDLTDINGSEEVVFNQKLREIHSDIVQKEADMVASFHFKIEETELKLDETIEMNKEANKIIVSRDEKISSLGSQLEVLVEELNDELQEKKSRKDNLLLVVDSTEEVVSGIDRRAEKFKKIIDITVVLATLASIIFVIAILYIDATRWNEIEAILGIIAMIGFLSNGVLKLINRRNNGSIPNLTDLFAKVYLFFAKKIHNEPHTKLDELYKDVTVLDKKIETIEIKLGHMQVN